MTATPSVQSADARGSSDRPNTGARIAGICWILLLATGSIALEQPRRVVPASAPATEFSAERAIGEVREIARAPHPVGSAEHARVRDYLLARLGALGLEPSIQKTESVLEQYGTAATVENIVARKRGETDGPAVLLAAHYDSVPAGPGAGDDGAGVATLLETARVLAAEPAQRNDVILLLTDGEELGLLGAKAFVAEHPWKARVGVVLNFDNRGTRGAVLMYETSPGNLSLMREFARAVPVPRASSLAGAVAESMPNSSDFYVFRRAKLAGLNFAFIGAPENYHAREDTAEHVDLRTLQHAGDYALPLVRRLANADLSALAGHGAPDAVYFNVGDWEAVYPQSWARPLGIAALALFLAVAVLGVTRARARPGGIALGIALCLVTLIASWRAADWLVMGLSRTTREGIPLGGAGPYLFHPLYAIELCCLALGLVFAAWEVVGIGWKETVLAGAFVWTLLAALLAFRMPAGSYLGIWPLVPLLMAMGALFAWRECPRPVAITLTWLGAIPAVGLLAPLFPALHLALGLSGLGAPALAMLAALTAWLLAPLVAPRGAGGLRLAPLVLAAGAVLLVASLRTVRYDAQHPRPEAMAYVLDSDHAAAQWMSPVEGQAVATEAPTDAWRQQYLSPKPRLTNLPIALGARGSMLVWAHEAPAVELVAPEAVLLEEKRENELRTVRFRVRSRRHAARLSIKVQAPLILPVRVDGHAWGEPRNESNLSAQFRARAVSFGNDSWSLLYAAPPEDGVEITLMVPTEKPLELILADISDGLPATPGQTFAARPAEVTQQHFADATVVLKSYSF